MNTPYHIAYMLHVAALSAITNSIGRLSESYQSFIRRSILGDGLKTPSACPTSYMSSIWLEKARTSRNDVDFLTYLAERGLDAAHDFQVTSEDINKEGVVPLHNKTSPFMACVHYATLSSHNSGIIPMRRDNLRSIYRTSVSKLSASASVNVPPLLMQWSDYTVHGKINAQIKALCLHTIKMIQDGPKSFTGQQTRTIGNLARFVTAMATYQSNHQNEVPLTEYCDRLIASAGNKSGYIGSFLEDSLKHTLLNIFALGNLVHDIKPIPNMHVGHQYGSFSKRISNLLTGDVITINDLSGRDYLRTDGVISGFGGNNVLILCHNMVEGQLAMQTLAQGLSIGQSAAQAFEKQPSH